MDWPLPPLIIFFFNDAGIRGGSRLCSETLLLSPLCFHCCQEGSVIKLPFLSLTLCPTVLVSSYRGGGGGGYCLHTGDCFTRGYRKVRSKNQWGNSSAASNSISASQDPLRGIGISRAPKGRIINMTDRGMREEEGGRGREMSLGWNVRCAGVFQDSAKQNFILLTKTASTKTFLCSHVCSSQERRSRFPSKLQWFRQHTRWCPACRSFIGNLGGSL